MTAAFESAAVEDEKKVEIHEDELQMLLRKKNLRPSMRLLRRERTEFLQDVTVEEKKSSSRKISQHRQSSIHWEGPSLIVAGLVQYSVPFREEITARTY